MFSQRSEDVGTLTERTCLEGANSKLTLRSQGETFRKCLQMVMGWSGLGWGWKSPSGSLILASFLFFFGFPLVSCFSQHRFRGGEEQHQQS